ncbi:MAG: ABC transporter permease [Eubacteriales bacterium]
MKEIFGFRYFNILKQIALFFLALFIISILTFVLIKLQPGDPAANYMRAMHMGITEETLEHTRKEMNLDKPVVEQYMIWLSKAAKFDFGNSYATKSPVWKVVKDAMIPTFKLGFVAFIMLIILSCAVGFFGAMNHEKIPDYIVQGISFVCVSIPTFWLGYMLIILFSIVLKLLPASGMGGPQTYIIPAFCLMLPLVGQTGLFIRKVLLEEMEKPHVKNALIRGVDRKYIIANHLLKNIAIPTFTVISSNIMYLISGSVLIEEVFSWPGLGRMFVAAVKLGDLPLIQGSLLFFGVLAIVINSGTQQIVYYLNPHMRRDMKLEK